MGFLSYNDIRDLETGLYRSKHIVKLKKKIKNCLYNDILFKSIPFILGFGITIYIIRNVF
jgi:hypothetical protein